MNNEPPIIHLFYSRYFWFITQDRSTKTKKDEKEGSSESDDSLTKENKESTTIIDALAIEKPFRDPSKTPEKTRYKDEHKGEKKRNEEKNKKV